MGNGTPTPLTSPWSWQALDYQNNAITISIPFNTTTGALRNATVTRDPACVYTHIYLGLGPDGTPNTTTQVFTVPAGTTTVTTAQLASIGLNVISDVTSLQITGGP